MQRKFRERRQQEIDTWVRDHHKAIVRDSRSTLAVLNLLFPRLQTRRMYFLREGTLSAVVVRALGLGSSYLKMLSDWRLRHSDFGLAVEKVMKHRVFAIY